MRAGSLRILAFCDYFWPHTEGGGERVAREVYTRLAAWGADVTVMTTKGPTVGWGEGLPGVRVVEVPGIDLTPRLGVQMTITRKSFRRALQLWHEMRPHVIHANSLEFQTSVSAARLQRRAGIPMVITAHIAGFDSMGQPWRTLGHAYERTIGRYLLAGSTRVIAVSEAVARYLRRYRDLEGRVRVIPNGVDHEVFRPSGRRDEGLVSILFVGRLLANKGPELAVEAVGALSREGLPIHLKVLGEGPMRGRLERQARELGLENLVTFAGPTVEMPRLLQEADVLVRPSQTEGMSLTVLEAMASRVCVVASDVPGNASLIRHGESGLLFPRGSLPGLIDELRRVVVDGDQRRRLAEAGYAASKAHSWDRSARGTLNVLVEAIEAGPRGRGR